MSDTPLALVTGGVRRVGAVIAQTLARAGYRLALHGNSDALPEDDLAKTLDETGADWCGFQHDFGAPETVPELIDRVSDHFGNAPDLLVNSASVFGQDDAFEADAETLDRHLRINLITPVLLSTALAKRRQDGDRACVVHMLDQRVRNPNRDQFSYTLSKQALADSVRTLAIACADRLRVNGVAPGLTLTAGEYGERQLENIRAMMPLERLPDPQDIADAVLYLARAEVVTGQVIAVDGGANLKSFERDFVHLGKD